MLLLPCFVTLFQTENVKIKTFSFVKIAMAQLETVEIWTQLNGIILNNVFTFILVLQNQYQYL